ncbi:hypothetical protein HMPREF0072_1265 [Anaerococcus lactolyticus ATCC 51172]|uniref:Uncharacterized protein n=1 Tax=Anaerococcus lactolyticus ATCC 51172 TaxID=525254 RepID=C2BFZ5_9FIRM|nr:hypothetical protein HMPREF0072_1265 [Anaerococcus lactolyticus ATCC 51172]
MKTRAIIIKNHLPFLKKLPGVKKDFYIDFVGKINIMNTV